MLYNAHLIHFAVAFKSSNAIVTTQGSNYCNVLPPFHEKSLKIWHPGESFKNKGGSDDFL